MNDWAEIRRLSVAEGLSQRAIAGRLSLSRVTVARALTSPTPPTYSRVATSSQFDEVADSVRALLEDTPSMPASVLAERVGWEGSPSWFRKQVSRVRPETILVDPADRLNYEPGDQTQCDLWFPPVNIPLGYGQTGSPPVSVMVSSFARYAAGIMVPTRTTGDLLAGMWTIIHSGFEAVPRRLLWDGLLRGFRTVELVDFFMLPGLAVDNHSGLRWGVANRALSAGVDCCRTPRYSG